MLGNAASASRSTVTQAGEPAALLLTLRADILEGHPPIPRLTVEQEDLTERDSEPTSVHGCGPTIRSLRVVEDGEVSSPRDNV